MQKTFKNKQKQKLQQLNGIAKLSLTVSIWTELLYIHLIVRPPVSTVTFFSCIFFFPLLSHATSQSPIPLFSVPPFSTTLPHPHPTEATQPLLTMVDNGHGHGGHEHGEHRHGGHGHDDHFSEVHVHCSPPKFFYLSFAQWNVV